MQLTQNATHLVDEIGFCDHPRISVHLGPGTPCRDLRESNKIVRASNALFREMLLGFVRLEESIGGRIGAGARNNTKFQESYSLESPLAQPLEPNFQCCVGRGPSKN